MMYQHQNMGIGSGFSHGGHNNVLSGSGKIGLGGHSGHSGHGSQPLTGTPNTAVQYRGYSPSKPKWKNNV